MDVPNNGGHGKHLTRIHLNLPLLTEQATVSGVTDGGQGGEPPPPWQAKYKNWALFS